MDFLNLTLTLVLVAAAALLGVWALLAYGRARRRRLTERLLGPVMAAQAVHSVHLGRRRLRAMLLVCGLVFVLVAAARPWWGQRLVPAPQRSRDLLVALDCSRSMLAKDVTPSRFEHAKWLVRELFRRFPGDRFGLIAFAGDAFLECPLTLDRSTLLTFLDDMDTATIPVGGTNIGQALDAAQKAFKGAEGGDRAVILISDGDELQGDSLARVGPLKEEGVPLLIVGLGSPDQGTPIQLPDNTFLRDSEGRMIATRLDEARLKRLAQESGGVYVRTTTVDPNLNPILARIKAMVPEEDEQTVTLRPIDRFQIPLVLGVLCLLARLFIGERRALAPAGAAAAGLRMLAMASSAHAQQLPPPAQPGLSSAPTAPGGPILAPPLQPASPAAGGTAAAPPPDAEIEALRAALEKAPAEDRPRLHFNLGVRLHEKGDLAGAASEYQATLGADKLDPQIEGRARWNLGALQHQQARQALATDPAKTLGGLGQAQAFYRDAMRILPGQPELAGNQEQLLGDRQVATEAKKLQDAFNEKRAKALKETAQALQKQQQTGKPGEGASQRADDLSAANQQSATARDAAADLESFLDQFPPAKPQPQTQATPPAQAQPPPEPPANMGRQARESIEQAMQAQNRAAQPMRTEEGIQQEIATAEKHLENAVRALGGQPPGQDGQKQDKSEKNDQKQGEPQQGDPQQAQQDQGKPQQQPGDQQKQNLMQQLAQQQAEQQQKQGDENAAAQENGQAFDKEQARGILSQMQDQERELRQELKMKRMQDSRVAPVEKDW